MHGTTIEMTDLKKKNEEYKMREFEVSGKVNQSQKKREKRKMQKEQEKMKTIQAGIKATEEQKNKAKLAYQDMMKNSKHGQKTEEGKVLKKKAIPKKVVSDETGSWEVVDSKKSVLVEEDDSADSDLSME